MPDDPYRMFLVVRRGAPDDLARAAELAGAAAVGCVRAFARDERFADAFAAWGPRPGKVVLRARPGQWTAIAEEPHALAGDPESDGVLALPPRRRSERGPVLQRMQAHSRELPPPPARREPGDDRTAVTYLLNPDAPMSAGKTLAQVAHAAVMAAGGGTLEPWVQAGCPGRLLAPDRAGFAAATAHDGCVAEVVDAGLTELPPGTVTVRALAP